MKYIDRAAMQKNMAVRSLTNNIAKGVFLAATLFILSILAILIIQILNLGLEWLTWDFLTSRVSSNPERAGIFGAIMGSLWLMIVVIPVTFIVGVGSAIYLELYAKQGKLRDVITVNIYNLAGVPSIVYGLLGLTIFSRFLGLGSAVLAGGLTLSLLVLPILIVSAQEAIRAVPKGLSEASYGMGATKWQTVTKIILPAAIPGVITGSILAVSRAIGETAPLTVLGIPVFLIPYPTGLFDSYTALPMQIYYWTMDSVLVEEYLYLAGATIIVLLVLLILLNSVAIYVRNRFSQKY